MSRKKNIYGKYVIFYKINIKILILILDLFPLEDNKSEDDKSGDLGSSGQKIDIAIDTRIIASSFEYWPLS